MDIRELQERAVVVQNLYKQHNEEKGQKDWDVADYTQGFVGDVGDLTKLVMAKTGHRHIEDVEAKLAHEVADCLWSVLVIAGELNIDIEKSFIETMEQLENKLRYGN